MKGVPVSASEKHHPKMLLLSIVVCDIENFRIDPIPRKDRVSFGVIDIY